MSSYNYPPVRSYYAPAAYKIRGSRPPLSGANHFDTHEPVELSKFVKPIFHRFVPPHPCTFFVKPILRNYSHHGLHKTGSTLLSIWDLPFYTVLPRPKKNKTYDVFVTSGIWIHKSVHLFCSPIAK